MDARLSALFHSTECFYGATFPANIHIAIVRDWNSFLIWRWFPKNLSSFFRTATQDPELELSNDSLHLSLYNHGISDHLLSLFFFFKVFSPPYSPGMPMEVMHSMVQIFASCLWCSSQASVQQNCSGSAAFWVLWAASVLTAEFTAPSQLTDIKLKRPFSASLW